jgi:hypothetical protein
MNNKKIPCSCCNGYWEPVYESQLMGSDVIPEHDKIYLKLSEESYLPKENRNLNVDGYLYDQVLSTQRTAIYANPNNKQLIIAHRGTVPTDQSDLKQDALIIAGQFDKSDRLKRALETVNEALKKYSGYTLTNTGHSLGGRVAGEIGRRMNIQNSKVIGFNIGSSPFDIARGIKEKIECSFSKNEKCQKLKKQNLYSTGIDPVSISSLLHHGQTTLIKPESGVNVHSLKSFK